MHPILDHYVAERELPARLRHARLIAGEYHRVGSPSPTLGLIAAGAAIIERAACRLRRWAQGPVAAEPVRAARTATGR
ncbi:MAG: hypothetical protein Kow0010_13890 [Dehalococcoidia bacterium]